eukprot:TRINITY_DN4919_c0_g1_i3.p1 TRINITY_DN4919_c0_g1~~TRINITY_DN4919_c0_g1_i3.p1  ORF type:complete len:442 (-),score=89.09 TRINITY_DN4919_c0_g1_i3:28-1353(-)
MEDISELSPVDPRVMAQQATINIGIIGHVTHGKSTLAKALSGVTTVRHHNELLRGITIKLGYANAKIYKCDNPLCPRPGCYQSYGSSQVDKPLCARAGCGHHMTLMRHVSFVDCPGHHLLMSTMLNGASVMDAAMLLIGGNEPCPQPQTSEHLAAVEIMKLRHLLVLQNKMDLIQQPQAQTNYEEIKTFVTGTIAEDAPIIPVSAQMNMNMDVVCEYLVNKIPVPIRDFTSPPHLVIVRSFDINRPGQDVDNLLGGVAGGSLSKGILRVGDVIEIRPGVIMKHEDKTVTCSPIVTKITSLFVEGRNIDFAVPGGLIGVGTTLDPTLCRADRLVGQVLGLKGQLPSVYNEIEVSFFLLRKLLGTQERDTKVSKVARGEVLCVTAGSATVGAIVVAVKGDLAKLKLTIPACAEIGSSITMSRRINRHWRLIGWGAIKAGIKLI